MPWWAGLLLASGLVLAVAGEERREAEKSAPVAQEQQEPPEEDESVVARKTYDFNPLQASKELRIGNFYFKKGSYRAAAQRYREATRWNDGYAEAWLKLGEASEKLKDGKSAREAYTKYLELEPESKNAAQIRRKLKSTKE